MIFKFWKNGESYRNISSNLNIPFTTINSLFARFKRRNKVGKKRTGAPRKISPISSRKLGRLINQNAMVMHEDMQEDLHSSGCSVINIKLVSNEMPRNGLKLRRLKKTPLLLKRYRDARLKFMIQHKEKENSFWERLLWTDESKIELFGHNYWNHVWRKDSEAITH